MRKAIIIGIMALLLPIRAYNAQSDKETRMRKLPENVRGLIEQTVRRLTE